MSKPYIIMIFLLVSAAFVLGAELFFSGFHPIAILFAFAVLAIFVFAVRRYVVVIPEDSK